MSRPFRIYGHRGAAAHHPENTLVSFRAAVDGGANAVETDVRLSQDGQVVVFHDASGARTCGVRRRLRDTSWADIRSWDAGGGEHPVLLSDLLDAFPDVFVNVDVKDNSEAAARATLEVIRAHGAMERVGLGTFHTSVARALRAAGWSGQLALCVPEVAAVRLLPRGLARRLIHGDALQIPVGGWGLRLDRARFIARSHQLGLRVDYWTVDDPDHARRLVADGADGIVTNDPAKIAGVLGRRAE
jgi:glycerophosphoryl diester phosphodiesterase